jgi:flagellar FliL protein
MGTYSVDDIDGKIGRDNLANSIKDAINVKLEDLEGFGGVEGVHFTSFVLQ